MVKIASCCWVKKRGRKVCGLAASGVLVEQEYSSTRILNILLVLLLFVFPYIVLVSCIVFFSTMTVGSSDASGENIYDAIMLHNKLCFLACLLTFTGTHSFNVLSNDHSSCKSTAATAHRFPNNQKSFRKDKIIGLGGGIEYAFDDSFCTWLKPSMRDETECHQLKLATHTALALATHTHFTCVCCQTLCECCGTC